MTSSNASLSSADPFADSRKEGRRVLREMPPAARAVIYARISKDNKQGSGLGVAKQVSDCRELAARLGLEVIEPVREDNDLTAFKGASRSKPRPGYTALLEDIRSGRAQVVLAWHTDRLHRDTSELEEYIEACGEGRSGVPTNTVKGGDLDLSTSSGRMVARILGAVARQEVEHMIERMESAHERIRNAGGRHGGPRPFGYEPDGPSIKNGGGGGYVQVPEEAAAIRKACARLLAEGARQPGQNGQRNTEGGTHAIAWEWNKAGLRTPAGPGGKRRGNGQWNGRNVSLVLTRALTAGLIEYRGEVVGKGNWEPIIDEGTWRAVRSILKDEGRRTTPGPKPRWLLTGVLICGVCGGRTFRVLPTKWGFIYQCKTQQHNPDYPGPRWHLGRQVDPLDGYVREIVIERLRRPDVVSALNARPAIDVAALDTRRTAINAELEEWARAPGITPRQLQIRNAPLLAELDEVERQISEGLRGDPLPEFAGKDPEPVWDGLAIERKRAVLRMLLRVKVLPVGKGGSRRGKRLEDGRVPFDYDTVEILPPEA